MTTLKDKAYDYLRYPEDTRATFYRKDINTLTIGTGYTPIVKGPKGWVVRPEAADGFKASGKPLSADELGALRDYAAAMNKPANTRNQALADTAYAKLSGISLSKDESRQLYDQVHDRYQRVAERAVGKERFDQLDDGRKAVLIGLAYQSEVKMSEIGPNISQALDKKDWQAVAGELRKVGTDLKDPRRYNRAALWMIDPDLPGRKEVEPGDTVSSFAKKHGTTVDELVKANPELSENPNRIRAGTPLVVPAPQTAPAPEKRSEAESEADAPQESHPAHADSPAEKPIEEAKAQEPERSQAARAFLDKIAQPFDKPALTIALRDPASWSADEAKSVMADYLTRQGNDPFLKQLSDLTGEHMKAIYGDGALRYDATGRMIDPKPIRPYAPAEQEARTPEGYPLNDAINWAGERVANRIDRHGIEKAISWLQGGLNMIGYKENRLLEDGQFGPETDFAFRKTVAAKGPGRVEDGLALAEFRDYARQAERKNDVSDLAHRTLDIFGPLYRMNPQDEPKHESGALQASLNDLGPKHLGDSWQPLKLDDWIGPKTTQSFADVLSAVGSDTLAQNYGSWLGLLDREDMG